jgi:ribosomal protein S12 methylthiotransferase accessory factor
MEGLADGKPCRVASARMTPGAKKGFRTGTHRTVAPAAVVERIRPLVGDFGITRVANVTGLDRIGLPVVMVARPNARSIAVQQGKGLSLDAARASGLMEAVESFHAEHILLPVRLASRRELEPAVRLVSPATLPHALTSRYHDDLPMLWIEGRELLAGEPVWLPYELVHANFTLPQPPGSGCFPASTNGLASGNHPLEALVHGLCEVIERDATTLFHALDRPGRDARRLDPASVTDDTCREVIERLEEAGFGLGLFDCTTDLGVPCFRALLLDQRHPYEHIGIGAGCHPARDVALLRALTEAVQVRMTYIVGARDDLLAGQFTRAGRNRKLAHARLMLGTARAERTFDALPSFDGDTFDEDLEWLLERCHGAGLGEVVAVDLSRPEFGLPVVRVVVPGLEPPDDGPDYVIGPRARRAGEAGR